MTFPDPLMDGLKGEFARGGQGAVLRVWDSDLRRTLAHSSSFRGEPRTLRVSD